MDTSKDRTRPSRLVALLSMLIGGAGGVVGCSSNEGPARPLTAEQFAARNGVTFDGRATGNPIDRAGAVHYDSANVKPNRSVEPPPDPGRGDTKISSAVSDTITGPYRPATVPTDTAPGVPTTTRVDLGAPTTSPAVVDQGPVVVPVGFVVMEVNGKAIWSDKVLGALERASAAEAKRNNEKQFQQIAASLLGQQVEVLKREELEVASAEQSLEAQDRSLAQALTTQWRAKQITAAGGSLEMAKKKARAEGWDFEELVTQQYRQYLVQLFYQKRVYPNIQVAASDVRAYYERNREKEFNTPGRIKFRVIRVDPAGGKFVSKDEAVAAAEKIHERAKTEDFAKLAEEINGDGKGGLAGTEKSDYWMQPGSYRWEAVEKAVMSVRPGQITEVIQEGGQLFIAKLVDAQEAKSQGFEDQMVQDKISQKLRGQQIQAMREKHIRDLESNAVTQRKDGKMAEMLDLVMKCYPEWAGKSSKG